MAILTDNCLSVAIDYYRRDPGSGAIFYTFDFRWLGRAVFSSELFEDRSGRMGRIRVSDCRNAVSLLPFLQGVLDRRDAGGCFWWTGTGGSHRLVIRADRPCDPWSDDVVLDFGLDGSMGISGASSICADTGASLHVRTCFAAESVRAFLVQLKNEFLKFDAGYRLYHEFYVVFDYAGAEEWPVFSRRFRKYMQGMFYFLGREVVGDEGGGRRFLFRLWESRDRSGGPESVIGKDAFAEMAREVMERFPEICNLRFEYATGDRCDRFVENC